MKKLLSLLSVLISGTTVPTLITDIPYKKNTIKNLSELNWTGLNINKNKRDTKNNQTKHIFKTNGVEKPSEQQIKEKVKELNPQLDINKINVTDVTENSAVITINCFSSQKTINFKVDKSVPINDVIKNNYLGEIDIDEFGGNYDEQLFKNFLKQLNPQLDINKINVTDVKTNTAKVNSNDTSIYTGKINITYSRPVKSIIKNFELGSIIVNGYLPTEQQIKDKLKEKNPSLTYININNFEVKDITSRNAKISFVKKDILSGEVVVNFISNINLNKIITNSNLGEFKTENLSNPTEQQIKDKLKEIYSDLDITKIKVKNISNNNATIVFSDNNFYSGGVIVNYTISVESFNW